MESKEYSGHNGLRHDNKMDSLKENGMTGKSYKMVLREETFTIPGACMEVHNTLGRGGSEKVYQDALEQEFILRNPINTRINNPNLCPYRKELLRCGQILGTRGHVPVPFR